MKNVFLSICCFVTLVATPSIQIPVFALGSVVGVTSIDLVNISSSTSNLTLKESISSQNPTGRGQTNPYIRNATIAPAQPTLIFTGKTALDITHGNNIAIIDKNTHTGFLTANNYFNLDSGNILISPEHDIAVHTNQATVTIGGGATVFLMESGPDVIIYDLYQSKPKQVSIIVDNHMLLMEPGRMLVLTREMTHCFQDLDADYHFIKYRRVQPINLQDNKVRAYEADFSIFSALVRIQPLKQLIESKNRHDKQLLEKLLKTAAMLRT